MARTSPVPEHLSKLSPDVAAAWRESFLKRLPERAAKLLVETAIEIEADQGQIVRREVLSAPAPPLLVVSGLVRVFVSSTQGRAVTIRYVRPGAVTGLSASLAGGARHGMEAVTRARMLVLQSNALRHLAQTDVEVAWSLCQELRDNVLEITDHLSTSVFQSVIERVAATLLELAVEEADGTLVLHANQQQIADAVGSVREVVARSLRQLRSAGLIDRAGSATVLTDVPSLHRLAAYGVGDSAMPDAEAPDRRPASAADLQ